MPENAASIESNTPSATARQKGEAKTNARASVSLRKRWRALLDRIPMTWQGFVLLAVCGVVLQRFGFVRRDWILLMIGLFGVSLALLSAISVGLVSLYLGWRLRRLNHGRTYLPIMTDTSRPAISGFLLPRFVPPFIDFYGYWDSPDAEIHPASVFPDRTEEVRFASRGCFDEIVRVFEVRDLFGLAEVRWERREPRVIEVWPQMHGHPAPFVRSFADGDEQFVPSRPRRGDLVDTRQYQPGDSIRLIHWKMFARSGIPIVRTPEPSASFERQMVVYLISDEDDDFAARVARHALEHGGFGRDWKFGADRGDDVATEIHVARRLLAMSGTRPARYGTDLDSFLQRLAFNPESQRLILYASGALHRWFPKMEPLLKRYGSVTTLIIANEVAPSMEAWKALREDDAKGPEAPSATPLWKRLLLQPAQEEPAVSEVVDPWGELRRLTQEGLQIQLLQPPQNPNVPKPSRGRRGRPGVPPPSMPPRRPAPQPMRSAPQRRQPRPPGRTPR